MNDFFKNINKDNVINFSNFLYNLSPIEYISLGCISAIIISNYLNPNEQNTLGNFLEMIGQILLTSYAQSSVVDPNYISFSLNQAKDLESIINKKIKDLTK